MKKKESIIFPTEGPCQDEFDVLWFLVQLECSGIIFGFRFSTTWVISFQSKVNGIGLSGQFKIKVDGRVRN